MEENTKKAYGKAIDILMSGTTDYKAICLRLAKEAPGAFIALHENERPLSPEEQLREHMIKFIKANPAQKVAAIKEHRTKSGFGLKESKDYVDELEIEIAKDAVRSKPTMATIDAMLTGLARGGFIPPEFHSGGVVGPGYKDAGSF